MTSKMQLDSSSEEIPAIIYRVIKAIAKKLDNDIHMNNIFISSVRKWAFYVTFFSVFPVFQENRAYLAILTPIFCSC